MHELLELALMHYGLKEIPGVENNPEILGFFKDIGHQWVQNDETAWCSAFLNAIAKRTGYQRSNRLDARSWSYVGKDTQIPEIGDIVILWRDNPNSWKGHVGLFINKDDKYVYVLGGNQNNSVCISPYPIKRVLRYRKPVKVK
jgi:uncharacterized protein (TIGR02594 family)